MVSHYCRRVDGPLNGDGSPWRLKILLPQQSMTGRILCLDSRLNTDACEETPSVAFARSEFFGSCRKEMNASDMHQISPGMRPGLGLGQHL